MSKILEKSYPNSLIDRIAEKESYRKEVYRPIYHMHKWWAQRLGSVFRALVLGSLTEDGNLEEDFYKQHDLKNKIVLDPFMGSGTTIGEAIKLGCKTVGCDINPVSSFIVKQSLNNVSATKLYEAYTELEGKVKKQIQSYYIKAHPVTGESCRVMYYFWVKTVTTPEGNEIPLFANYVFSKDAYPKKKPSAKIICPSCYNINTGRYDTANLTCTNCHYTFNPQQGPANRSVVTDFTSGKTYKILDLVKASGEVPQHKMYASIVLLPNGKKEYLNITDEDIAKYEQAKAEYLNSSLRLPDFKIEPGHNTNQTLNYNYRYWSEFFNYRQLHCLTILLNAIKEIEDTDIREQFVTLFSGTLEFNNMFCSFKGEGTGAVRHLFNNHILKPERTPLENSIWGSEKGSGTFSSLFKGRLLKAKEYLNKPFELKVEDNISSKVYCNKKMAPIFVPDFNQLLKQDNACLILNSSSSNLSGVPSKSIDAVVTDPPYFDFVHYSELSDFFYAWLKPILEDDYPSFSDDTSRRQGEVQSKSVSSFSDNLAAVFKECNRVLKDDGLLVFSFHHSRDEGWAAIFKAIHEAGFYVEVTYPVKAEMAVSTPKNQAKSPINIDSLIVLKKLSTIKTTKLNGYIDETLQKYNVALAEFKGIDRELSDNDKKVIWYSKLLETLTHINDEGTDLAKLIKVPDFIFEESEEVPSMPMN